MARDDADRLGGIHRRAAAETDEPVAAFRRVDLSAAIHERDVGVRSNVTEDDRALELFERTVREAGRSDAGIGHEHRPRDAELRHDPAELRQRTRPVHQPGRNLDRANHVDLHCHTSSLSRRCVL